MKTMNAPLISIITTCPICHVNHEIMVYADDYSRWQNGELAQNAFPYLTADEREMLISGICPDCWEEMFSFDDDDEEEDEDGDYEEELREYDLEMGFNPYEGCYDYDC